MAHIEKAVLDKLSYITIEGNIGAGKTTLSKAIAEQFNAKLILEQFHDNPFLPKFYDNPKQYSLPLELSFLTARYKQLLSEIQEADLFKEFTIADYYFSKSLIFAQFNLPADEYGLYRELFNIIYKQLPFPNVYVYLHVEVDRLLSNIKQRGRGYEQEIDIKYLQGIQDSYFAFFKTVKEFPVVVVHCNDIDFVSNSKDYQKVTDAIFNGEYKMGLNNVIL